MSENRWRRRRLPAVLLIVSAVLSGSSLTRAAPIEDAQALPPQTSGGESAGPDARAAAMRQVATSCAEDVARLCPELGDEPTPRDTTMCLRAYQVDLSFSCRAALHAAATQ